jgi:V-type H+-transporting ATPase proteolipid subunit
LVEGVGVSFVMLPNSFSDILSARNVSYPQLCAGLCCGLSGLAAGGCIGIIGDYGVRSVGYRSSNISVIFSTDKSGFEDGGDEGSSGDENKLFVGMLIMLIFSEALAL